MLLIYLFIHIAGSRFSLEQKSWKQQTRVSSKHYGLSHVIPGNQYWRRVHGKTNHQVLKFGLSNKSSCVRFKLRCNVEKEKQKKKKLLFLLIPSGHPTVTCKAIFPVTVVICLFPMTSSGILEDSLFGITYGERTCWQCPEETGVSHHRCHWSWRCCSSFPAWRSACTGWAGVPAFWPSTKQRFKISEISGT